MGTASTKCLSSSQVPLQFLTHGFPHIAANSLWDPRRFPKPERDYLTRVVLLLADLCLAPDLRKGQC